MLPVRLILSATSQLGAEPTSEEPAAKALARFLNGDLAGSAKHCQALLDGGSAVLAGKQGDFTLGGNAYAVTITSKTTELRALSVKEPAVTVPTTEFVELVAQWLGLLDRPVVT